MKVNLREAIERVRRVYVDNAPYRIVYGQQTCNGMLEIDRNAFIEACLAERDETPVTEDWLRSIGFKGKHYQGNDVLAMRFQSPIADSQWIQLDPENSRWIFVLRRWHEDMGTKMPPDSVHVDGSTRGKVRTMCRALGINLNIPENEA